MDRRRITLAALVTISLSASLLIAACGASATSERPTRGAHPRPLTPTAPSTTAAPTKTTPTSPDSTVPSPAPTGRFHIVGNDIVDPDGNVFYPIGANVAVRQGGFENGYTFNWRGTATGRSAAVAAWGWNTVRATVICNSPGTPNQGQIDAGIDALIDEYTARKIVVMVECHDVTGKNPTPADARVAGVYRFMERLAAKYATNPYVWFNVFNEPIEKDSPSDVEAWMVLQRDALARIRALAPSNVFVADIPGYGQAFHTFTGDKSVTRLGAGQCNVLYGWHAYGALGSDGKFGRFEDYADPVRSRANHAAALQYIVDHDIPVVVGEFGDPLTLDEGTAGLPIWNRNAARALIDLAPAAGVGLLWWHATGDSNNWLTYSLTADRSAPWDKASTGAGLSTSGQAFWRASQNKPGGQPFTGDLRASNC
ncbi:MAG: glycoside hydrolase family 5 protein [Actinobacteria bacterium]|nr:glycoside hydrolase family 5 protein [Actinomycetota bacterium]